MEGKGLVHNIGQKQGFSMLHRVALVLFQPFHTGACKGPKGIKKMNWDKTQILCIR